MGLLCFLHHVETLQLPFLFLSQPLEMDTLPMSQQQTLAPLGKLIGYFADYDSVAHFTPYSSAGTRRGSTAFAAGQRRPPDAQPAPRRQGVGQKKPCVSGPRHQHPRWWTRA